MKKNILKISVLLLSLLWFACGGGQETETVDENTEEEATEETVETEIEVAEPEGMLGEVTQAHGGLATFRGYKTVEYDLKDWPFSQKAPLNDHHVIDLQNRRVLITSDRYKVGYDGNEAWVNPSDDSLGLPSSFYYATPYYFFGLPFMMADEGASVEEMGTQEFDGNSYEVVMVTFGDGVGASPDDNYLVYLDPETKMVKMADYIVSHPALNADGKSPDELDRHYVVYEDYQEVNGMQVPHTITFRGWEEGKMGEELGSTSFENVTFKEEAMGDETFARQ